MENSYKILMVGLDLSKMDEEVIQYLPILIQAIPVEKIYFVHISKALELPENIVKKYPDLVVPIDETISDDIRSKVAPVLKGTEVEYDIIVQESSALEGFLKIAKIKNVDLIVLGRKKKLEGSGFLSGHIVRKSPTSILFVTEDYHKRLKNILIPIDFSSHSKMAVKLGLQIEESTGANLHFSHVYRVPSGYHTTGKSFEEFAEIMKLHAEEDYEEFCKSIQLNEQIDCTYLLADHDSINKLIYDHADRSEADLILIGSRGRTKTSALLLGSIVEKIAFVDSNIPILILKQKGESMSFFEALMKI